MVDAAPRMGLFERYLTLWVGLCIVVGTGLGHVLPDAFASLGRMEVAKVNLPVAALIWLLIVPMLLKVDFGAITSVEEILHEIVIDEPEAGLRAEGDPHVGDRASLAKAVSPCVRVRRFLRGTTTGRSTRDDRARRPDRAGR